MTTLSPKYYAFIAGLLPEVVDYVHSIDSDRKPYRCWINLKRGKPITPLEWTALTLEAANKTLLPEPTELWHFAHYLFGEDKFKGHVGFPDSSTGSACDTHGL